MKSLLLATASATVLALSLPVHAQGNALSDALSGPAADQMRKLEKLCASGKDLPKGLDCEALDKAAENPELLNQLGLDGPEQAEPAPDPKAPKAKKKQAEMPAAPAAKPADQAVTQAPEEPAKDEAADAPEALTDAETVAETPKEPAAEGRAVETPVEKPAKPAAPAQTADKAAPATVEDLFRELSGQEQADAVAKKKKKKPAAAAAVNDGRAGDDGAKMTEETVSKKDVRSSSEDFVTDLLTAKPSPKGDSGGGNDKTAETIAGAALLGLGAVALADILSGDERVVSNSGDRVVIEDNGQYRVLRNDDELLRRPGTDVQTFRYDDGSTRNVLTYEDGTVVETIRAADGRVLRRSRTLPDGTEVLLFDDTQDSAQVVVNDLPQVGDRQSLNYREVEADQLAAALAAQQGTQVGRSFSLNQIRNIDAVRQLVPEISVDTINFATDSAAIRPDEAEELAALGNAMRKMILDNPGEVFLIEGHTDAVGQYSYNLALSDRRAESVALALTEYFDVPPENMVLQGYGESDLMIETTQSERANRRAAVRRITPLLN